MKYILFALMKCFLFALMKCILFEWWYQFYLTDKMFFILYVYPKCILFKFNLTKCFSRIKCNLFVRKKCILYLNERIVFTAKMFLICSREMYKNNRKEWFNSECQEQMFNIEKLCGHSNSEIKHIVCHQLLHRFSIFQPTASDHLCYYADGWFASALPVRCWM
jgi:hypothetical protein